MREILFRAKAINRTEGREYRTEYKNGDWVFGLLSKPYRNFDGYIQPATMRNTNGVDGIEVDYETLGQYTGLTDKNGVRIFEGDILCSFSRSKKVVSVVKIGAFTPSFFYDFAHERGYDMSVKLYGFYAYVVSDEEDIMLAADMKLCSVIGNIHDNSDCFEVLTNEND